MLHACLDESGKFKDSDYVSFCGYISDFERWEGFSREWDALRTKRSVPPIHTTSVKDTGLLLEFAEIVQKHALQVLGVVVDVKAFTSRSEKFKKNFHKGNPHYLAFYTVISSIEKLLNGNPATVSLICDDEESQAIQCYKLLTGLKSQYPNVRRVFPSICFADDESYPPLQAADMLAHTARSVLIDMSRGAAISQKELYAALTGDLGQPLLYDSKHLSELESNIEKRVGSGSTSDK
jgi:hypothetical protein